MTTLIPAISAIGDAAKARVVMYANGQFVQAPLYAVTDQTRHVISPFQYGGKGDGVADDGAALNAAFAAIRAQAATSIGSSSNEVKTVLDLSGGVWKTTTSINATGIVGWNFTVRGGLVVGSCTGKAVFDLVGSRGYQFFGVGVYGDPASKPAAGFQAARPTASGFCDNASFYDCSTSGYFTRAAFHDYGQESTLHVHPTYFNSQHDARVAIFAGYDSDPFTSDYSTVMTGATSHINNKIINGDFRYLPAGTNIAAITGVTNAASGVVTAPNHPFANGDSVVFSGVGGMPGLQYVIATASAVTTNTFTINVDTTAMGTYTSGGSAIRQATKSPVLLSRAKQFHFDCSYIVSYGQPGLQITWPDAGYLVYDQIQLDILFEGSGCTSNVLLSPGANAASITGFALKTYNSNSYSSLISITDAGSVGLHNPLIESSSPLKANVPLGITAGKLGLYGARILYSGVANVPLSTYATGSNGTVVDVNTGLETYSNGLDGTYTPTVTAGSGTFTTLGTVVGNILALPNKTTYIDLDIPITTNGTAATSVVATLPPGMTAVRAAFITGRDLAVSGKTITGFVAVGGSTFTIFNYDNTYPGSSGARLKLSGWFVRS